MNNPKYQRMNDESFKDYCHRISSYKNIDKLTWDDIADIINTVFGTTYCASKYRMQEYKYNSEFNSEISDNQFSTVSDLDALRLEKLKLSDERIQINAMYRRISREDTLKEMALSTVSELSKLKPLRPINKCSNNSKYNEAILEISDWHYGIEIDNYWNKYDPDIAEERIAQLRDNVLEYTKINNVKKLHVVNLGDMIAGRIHLQLRLNSRFEVITQIMKVSELIANFIYDIASMSDMEIEYYDTLDNHSRLEPNIKESIDLESLSRITTWYLKERLKDIITFHENTFADDIIAFETLGYKVAGVHGHKDKSNSVIKNMTMFTQEHYDLVLSAHLHHFSANEDNNTLLISNGSLMGTDDFAEKLRLNSYPSQNLIIVTPDNCCECLYKINLN